MAVTTKEVAESSCAAGGVPVDTEAEAAVEAHQAKVAREQEEDDQGVHRKESENDAGENMEEGMSSAVYRERVGFSQESQLSIDGGSSVNNNTEPILKRKRPSCMDNGASVQVTYKYLTRESKKKLQEILRGWAEWQSQITTSSNGANADLLESGTEMYFPALQVGSDSCHKLPVWMDLPATKQAGSEHQPGEISLTDSQEREVEVPLYDRACNSTLSSQDSSLQLEQPFEASEEASRCFNCGSYSHGLKDCPRPRDNAGINAARKLHNAKKGSTPGSRGPSRYYQSTPGGKFDDLKPGVLGAETRQSLGIGELDPPPWLNRMRELGYPPGYIDGGDEEPSGITIFDGDEEQGKENTTEDGEFIDLRTPAANGSSKRMIVGFPGLNAPIPKDADENLWKLSPPLRHTSAGKYTNHQSVTKISTHRTSGGSSDLDDLSPDVFHPQRSQVQSHLSSDSSSIFHRSFSDNNRRGRSIDLEASSLMSGDLYRSPASNSPFARHDGLLSHRASLLPPRSPSPYLHSPTQLSPSSWHAYDNARGRTFLRPHVQSPPSPSLHGQRHSSPSYPGGGNLY